ncbi:MAG: Coenzyme F420 hydrogenase/dehydrogenase, beta subunit C-terminal domain [Clostridia bacterium]|nr:Coenzyme F420 hydrogenase/dehydrogenase, beta subunit C-terminal domain [Clostridia bacterium]
MIEIQDKIECCGCTACANICPKKAISMVEDEEGFKYPKIDKKKCIDCGLCDKICPIKNQKDETNIKQDAYIVRTKKYEVLKKSTSGGFFTPLSEYVLEQNGVVYGVAYDNDMNIVHMEISDKTDIQKLIGSKYIQSDLNDIFLKVKIKLENGKLVLFSGTPCQVYGLKSFLRKEYDNLITMDLVCHGVPSKKLWNSYKFYQEKKYKSKIKQAFFRNKTYGYHSATMRLVFENGKQYDGSALVDFMLKPFFAGIALRESCYDCKFKTKNHSTDFTVFDSWHVSEIVKDLNDDDKGYTNVMVNTKKAADILELIKDKIYFYKVDKEKIIKLDGKMVEASEIPHKNRKDFYKSIDDVGIEKTIKKYIPVKIKEKIWEKLKKYIYKIGLLKKIKNIKKRMKSKR